MTLPPDDATVERMLALAPALGAKVMDGYDNVVTAGRANL